MERRRHKRFSATAFLNMPVYLEPLPPYFGKSLKGKLIDLSAGGMAILIEEFIPPQARLNLALTFPDKSMLESIVEIKHAVPKDKQYLIGIEFLTVPLSVQQRIEKMSSDYVDCEARIERNLGDVCRTDCGFYNFCTKQQRSVPLIDPDVVLNMVFKKLQENPLSK